MYAARKSKLPKIKQENNLVLLKHVLIHAHSVMLFHSENDILSFEKYQFQTDLALPVIFFWSINTSK